MHRSRRFLFAFLPFPIVMLLGTTLLAILLLGTSTTAAASPLVSYHSESPLLKGVSVENVAGSDLLLVVNSSRSSKSTIFSVDFPARLVVDIPLTKSDRKNSLTRPKRIEAPAEAAFQAIRIASHEDKIRLVVDLKGSVAPQYLVSKRGSTIQVTIGPHPPQSQENHAPAIVSPEPVGSSAQSGAPTLAAKSPPKEHKPSGPTLVAARRLAKSGAAPVLAPPAPSSAPATPSQSSVVAPSNSKPSLQKIEFISAPSSGDTPVAHPTVRLLMNYRPQYRLSRSNDRSYKLRIADCAIASESLSLPFFPPQEFAGFTVVQAAAIGRDLEITIGTDRGVRISAVPGDTSILLQVADH